MPNITIFRATSGSQVVYFDSTTEEPAGIVNKAAVSKKYTSAGITKSNTDVLWEWNGVDVSQFESSASFTETPGGGGVSIQVLDDIQAPSGKQLVVSSSTNDVVVWLAQAQLDTNRFIIDYATNNIVSGYAGVAFLCEGTGSGFHGFGYVETGSISSAGVGWNIKINSGSVDSSATTSGGTQPPNLNKVEVLGSNRVNTTGSHPSFTWWVRGQAHGRIASQRVTDHVPGVGSWATGYDPSWNNLLLRRFGIALRGGSGGVIGFRTLVIRKHPLDK